MFTMARRPLSRMLVAAFLMLSATLPGFAHPPPTQSPPDTVVLPDGTVVRLCHTALDEDGSPVDRERPVTHCDACRPSASPGLVPVGEPTVVPPTDVVIGLQVFPATGDPPDTTGPTPRSRDPPSDV